jgi:hypothetical protein
VSEKRGRVQAARARLGANADRPSDDKVKELTGKRWEAWFSILDRWGARERKHGETVRCLMDEHHVPGWWAQSITYWYERARGIRLKHQQADGFTIYASKTIAVPIGVLFDAFINPRSRKKWLTGATMSLRTSQPGHTAPGSRRSRNGEGLVAGAAGQPQVVPRGVTASSRAGSGD